MATHKDVDAASTTATDPEFDLDVSIVESSPVIELMPITSDNCGQTCATACRDTGC
jgi:FxLD family lantipeptide